MWGLTSTGMDDTQAVTCEDCKDYDLCIPCLRGSDHGHDPSHQFARAHERLRLSDKETALLARGRNVRHEALCDNCDNVSFSWVFNVIPVLTVCRPSTESASSV